MSERALTVALTLLATCGFIAQGRVAHASRSDEVIQLAQTAGSDQQTDTNPTQPQPSSGVQRLQTRLTELGYYSGAINGVFDAATRDALASFQRENGLVGTGILDPITSDRLSNPQSAPASPNTAPDSRFIDPALEEPGANSPAPNPPNVLTQPEASPTPLPAVPSANDPKDLIESDGAGRFTETPETTPSPDNEALGEAAPNNAAVGEGDETAPGIAPSVEAVTAEGNDDSGLARIVTLGVIILGLGSLGTGLVLWLAKRSTSAAATTYPVSGPNTEHPGMGRSSAEPPLATPPSVLRNGQPSPHQPLVGDAMNIEAQRSPLAPPPEVRMAKINIIDELIQDLASPDPTTRHKAIWELGQRGNSAAVQPLTSLLIEADSHEQGLVLAALSEISIKTLKPMNRAVALALQGDNPEVRKNAIRDLTRIYDSLGQVGRLLGHATADSDPEVRQTANWALEQLNHMRLSANESAGLLPENRDAAAVERLPEDGSSSL